MQGWFLLFFCAITARAQDMTTFGTGLSSNRLYLAENEIFNYTLSPGAKVGVMTHFWTTGDAEIDTAIFSYYIDGETTPSIQFVTHMVAGVGFNDQTAPWGTKWMGKGAKSGGWFNNFRIPFQKSIRITGKLAPGSVDNKVIFIIVRGTEDLPIIYQGFQLPPTARLQLQRIENQVFDPLAWVRVADVPTGRGFLLSHTLSIASGNLNFLEGCYHAYTDYNQPFPGLIVSTGTEDYYDSGYYFNAGEFHMEEAGYTHFKQLANGGVEWSAYRTHEVDPVFFKNGFRFEWRNGDVNDDRGFKCVLYTGGQVVGSPTKSNVTSYTWLYTW